jgi:TonB family protein
MTRLFLKLVSLALAGRALSCSVSAAPVSEEEARKHVINSPRPEYPLEARKHYWTGSGIVVVDVDTKSGLVVGVRMLKTTGHAILDQAAIAAFSRWHFKPGVSFHQVMIPIRFVM